jgi:hypothetical protein
MNRLPDEVVAAVGRVTIAAGDLELILAVIAAERTGGSAFKIMAKPGEPLIAASGSIELETPVYRDAYLPAVERAAKLLAERHAVVHAMWVNDAPDESPDRWELLHYKTHVRHPADPRTLDQLAGKLMAARNWLAEILTARINQLTPPAEPIA